jgi:hypothetical protein
MGWWLRASITAVILGGVAVTGILAVDFIAYGLLTNQIHLLLIGGILAAATLGLLGSLVSTAYRQLTYMSLRQKDPKTNFAHLDIIGMLKAGAFFGFDPHAV